MALAAATLLVAFGYGCRVVDLKLGVKELDVLHEQTTNAVNTGANVLVPRSGL